jgi:mannose-1-phosphate guanylyltransferase
MNKNNYIVLMAGGSGTRLWPMSRESKPKQFHSFASSKSLLQDTYDRIKDLVPIENIYVSLGPNGLKESQEQLKDVLKENYIIEPVAKNTAPSILLSTIKIFKKNPLANIATISSDHTINKVSEFKKIITKAFNFIEKNKDYLATVGIKPDKPEIGYGYIKIGKKIPGVEIYEGTEFVEKPNLETAEKYLKSGKYLWNASYFVFSATDMIKMYNDKAAEIYKGLERLIQTTIETEEDKIINKAFEGFDKVPFDTAIAEKVDKIVVIPADLGWSDVGNWSSLYELLCSGKSDEVVTRGHHVGVGDKNCLFFAEDKLLATVGLEDTIVVDTPDVTLVCHKNKVQEVRDLIEKLKQVGKSKYL